jgi:hypothetical protein
VGTRVCKARFPSTNKICLLSTCTPVHENSDLNQRKNESDSSLNHESPYFLVPVGLFAVNILI